MRIGRTIVICIVSALAGAAGMYFYTNARAAEASQLVVQYHELEKKNKELETRNATLQLECSATQHHKQQEGVFFAEALAKSVEIRNLRRQLLVMASRNNEVHALRELLTRDDQLAHELSSEMFKENWLHVVARSDKAGISEIAKVFIDFGADRDMVNTEGKRPIDIAQCCGTGEVIDVLRNYKSKEVIRVSSITMR